MPGESRTGHELRHTLAALLRRYSGSRANVADELSARLGPERNISEHILSNWANSSKHGYHIPFEVVAELCEIFGNDSLLRAGMSERQLSIFELGEWAIKRLRKEPRRKRV